MGELIYRVLPNGDQWRLKHDGQSIAYTTRTAALKAAVNAAQGALRSSEQVRIHVEPAPASNSSGLLSPDGQA
jgi:hypothetical protein